MSRKVAGKKYAGSHSTVIDAAFSLVHEAEKDSRVEKISLGIIRQCPAGRGARSLKIKETSSGLELIIRGSSYAQTVYLYLTLRGRNEKNQLVGWLEQRYLSKRERAK